MIWPNMGSDAPLAPAAIPKLDGAVFASNRVTTSPPRNCSVLCSTQSYDDSTCSTSEEAIRSAGSIPLPKVPPTSSARYSVARFPSSLDSSMSSPFVDFIHLTRRVLCDAWNACTIPTAFLHLADCKLDLLPLSASPEAEEGFAMLDWSLVPT